MGDAGAVTGRKELIDKVRMYRDHGRETKYSYEDYVDYTFEASSDSYLRDLNIFKLQDINTKKWLTHSCSKLDQIKNE